jgi:hypothetical protein
MARAKPDRRKIPAPSNAASTVRRLIIRGSSKLLALIRYYCLPCKRRIASSFC